MSDLFPGGQYFRGYLASDDITTAAIVPLFDNNGVAITIPLNKRPILTSIFLNNGATASIITLFADTNGDSLLTAGEELVSANLAANGSFPFVDDDVIPGRVVTAGSPNKNVLMVKASAASVGTRIVIVGRIINS
jgi:hypothetical protein